jgi:hypothetical protein
VAFVRSPRFFAAAGFGDQREQHVHVRSGFGQASGAFVNIGIGRLVYTAPAPSAMPP